MGGGGGASLGEWEPNNNVTHSVSDARRRRSTETSVVTVPSTSVIGR